MLSRLKMIGAKMRYLSDKVQEALLGKKQFVYRQVQSKKMIALLILIRVTKVKEPFFGASRIPMHIKKIG